MSISIANAPLQQFALVTLIVLMVTQISSAQSATKKRVASEPPTSTKPASATTASTDSKIDDKRLDRFKKRLTNTKFVGQFTVSGQQDKAPRKEEYTISKVTKLADGDWWEIEARIQYGDHDLTVPMPMEVKWAGNTPVITVDRLFVPGLGTFDARVLLRKDKYSGTWAHGKVGGHLFGKIVKVENEQNESTR